MKLDKLWNKKKPSTKRKYTNGEGVKPVRFLDTEEQKLEELKAKLTQEDVNLNDTFKRFYDDLVGDIDNIIKINKRIKENGDGLTEWDSCFNAEGDVAGLYKMAKAKADAAMNPEGSQVMPSGMQTRLNSLYSERLGIGQTGSDPLETVGGRERFFHSFHARFLVRSLDILERIVSAPAKDSVASGWTYTIKTLNNASLDPDKKQKIFRLLEKRLDDLRIGTKLQKMVRDSRLYTLGSMWYPVIREDKRPANYLATPLNYESIQEVECVNVLEPEQFTYVSQTIDPAAKNFGEIEYMFLKGAYMHADRYKFFVDHFDPYLMRGLSMLDRVLIGVKGLNIAQWAIVVLLLKYSSIFVYYEKNRQVGFNRDQLNQVLEHIQQTMTAKSVTSLPDAVKVEQLTVSFTGFSEATQFLYEYLASASGVPISILRSGGKGSTTGEMDTRLYFDRVHTEEQRGKVEPALQMILNMLKYEKDNYLDIRGAVKRELGLDPKDYSFGVDFNPLIQLNAKEKNELEMLKAQKLSVDINQIGSLTPAEARIMQYPDMNEIDSEHAQKYEEFVLFQEGRDDSAEDGDGAAPPVRARKGRDMGGGRKPTNVNPTAKRRLDTQKRK